MRDIAGEGRNRLSHFDRPRPPQLSMGPAAQGIHAALNLALTFHEMQPTGRVAVELGAAAARDERVEQRIGHITCAAAAGG